MDNHIKCYSQFGEDAILAKIFNFKHQGFCIEIGAFDGVTLSNTYFFEKLGWECLVIEPIPSLWEKIKTNRKCLVANVAISNFNGEAEIATADGAEILSSINPNQKHLNRIKSENDTVERVKVRTQTMESLLKEIHRLNSPIDCISIDVEGHELEVLQGLPFHSSLPRILIIEDNTNNHNFEVTNFLSKFGYIRFKRTGCNDWYAQNNDYNIINYFDYIILKLRAIRVIIQNKFKK